MLKKFDSFIDNFSSKRNNLIGLNILTKGIGFTITYIYLINISQIISFIGPLKHRISTIGYYTIYNYNTSILITYYLFYFGLILSIAMIFKNKNKILMFLNLIFFTSYSNACYIVSDGGDNLLKLLLIYILFLNLNKNSNKYQTIIHNFGYISIVTQLCILYFVAGISKSSGALWQSGEALHYIYNLNFFSNTIFGIDKFIASNRIICNLLCYSTLIFQISYPFIFLSKKLKNILIYIGIFFHIGIMINMNLFSFSLIMILCDLSLINDSVYFKLSNNLKLHLQGVQNVFSQKKIIL